MKFPVAAGGVHDGAVVDRFLAKVAIVDDETSCWEWIGTRRKDPSKGLYGIAHVDGRTVAASRLAWEIANGTSVPADLLVRHRCDNPPCVRPSHLLVGTQRENMLDMVERGRGRHVSHLGSSNGYSKLTEDDAREIVSLAEAGMEQADIARKFNVAQSNVSFIVTGRSWSHATGKVYVRRLREYQRRGAA